MQSYIDLNLVRLYVNKLIIDEDDQCEIQAVIPLMKHTHGNGDAKEINDQDTVLRQLDRLGYNHFIEESCITHFILTNVSFPLPGTKLWIDYWFNEFAVRCQWLNASYRFIFTRLSGSKGKICTKTKAVSAYKQWRPLLGTQDVDYNVPVEVDVEDFRQTVNQARPKWLQRNNFNETSERVNLFYYKSLTDNEIKDISLKDLAVCKKLGLDTDLDNIFRMFSGLRQTYIISPREARKKCTKTDCIDCETLYDQRVEYLTCTVGGYPIIKSGLRGTVYYYPEENTVPIICNADEIRSLHHFES